MKKQSLTAKQVTHMQPDPDKRLEVPAGPPAGLYLVVHPTGKKAWIFRYRFRGRTRGLTFEDSYPDMTLAQARAEAHSALKDLENGIDPAEKKTEEKSEPNSAKEVATEWIDRYVKPNTRTWPEVQRILNREVLPYWKTRLITEIGKAEIVRLLDSIMDSGRPILANRTLSVLKRWFNWCVERGIVDTSPADRIRPPEVTKPGRIHDVPLSTAGIELLENLPRFEKGSYVFTTTSGERAVSGFSKAKIGLDTKVLQIRQEKAAKVGQDPSKVQALAHWTIHDLRRTVATWIAGAGFPPHVLSALLNHSPGTAQGVTSIYNRFRYLEERRQALQAWSEHVLELVNPQRKRVTA